MKTFNFTNCANAVFHHTEMLLSATSHCRQNSNLHFIDLDGLKEESNVLLSAAEVTNLAFHPEKSAVIAATDSELVVAGWDPAGVYGKYN